MENNAICCKDTSGNLLVDTEENLAISFPVGTVVI